MATKKGLGRPLASQQTVPFFFFFYFRSRCLSKETLSHRYIRDHILPK